MKDTIRDIFLTVLFSLHGVASAITDLAQPRRLKPLPRPIEDEIFLPEINIRNSDYR